MKKYLADKKFFIYLFSFVSFLLIWEVISRTVKNNIILPSIFDVGRDIVLILKSEESYTALGNTFMRIFTALIISLVFSLILGIIVTASKFTYNFFHPYISFMKYAPIIAMITIILIWFPKEIAPVIIGFLMSFPIFYDTVVNSIRKLNPSIVELIKTFQINKRHTILKIYFPSVLFGVINIISSVFGLIIKTVIASEVYSQPKYGIGSRILYEKLSLNTSAIIAWIIIIVFISFILDFLFKYIKNKLFFWRDISEV